MQITRRIMLKKLFALLGGTVAVQQAAQSASPAEESARRPSRAGCLKPRC
ncbi:hypothetical protein [Duganella caerulea]